MLSFTYSWSVRGAIDGNLKTEKLDCEQAPGFEERDEHGVKRVCEILVAMQGRTDAARLFGLQFTTLAGDVNRH